jgi:hypothetical protein
MSVQFRLYRGSEQLTDLDTLVDMSDSNAGRVLDALGYGTGAMDHFDGAEPFLGRVLIALGLEPADEGVPAHQDGPRWTEGGRRPGYLQERLEDLRALAERGRALGDDVEVVWS